MQSYQRSISAVIILGPYFKDFLWTLNEEFSDCGARITEMTIIYFETFQISFSKGVDSCAVHRLADFVCVFKEKSPEFTGNGTTNRGMQKPVLQSRRPVQLAR